MRRAGHVSRPIALAALLALLGGCAAHVDLPRRSPGLPASTGGGGAEAVFAGSVLPDAGEGWEFARRDAALALRAPDDGLNRGLWPAPDAPSLADSRRLWLRSTDADSVLYFDRGARGRRRSAPWWWGW
jgi:hypothetical protein